ncbi:unnamed protein product [Ceratitis capitata]|uniref:(Mediterranean fruit fly) hypothetical protein n=1 Tax=Ceratitis capitata TaxID=7213 RepID=A0A811U2D4_CERCA|nr:unnamed protein product [Ceratitis capitata]
MQQKFQVAPHFLDATRLAGIIVPPQTPLRVSRIFCIEIRNAQEVECVAAYAVAKKRINT